MIEPTTLILRQHLPLDIKILMTRERIWQWYYHFHGEVYVSSSGGVDSLVLAHIAREIFPDIVIVYCDTGLEYPDVRTSALGTTGIQVIKPELSFKQVIDKYGYPVVSKEQSQFIQEYRDTKSKLLRHTRWYGNKKGRGKISDKWKFLANAPFKISDKCCDFLKKRPFEIFEKQTGLKPITGILAEESSLRRQQYLNTGCNAFDTKRPVSHPLAFWTKADIWEYIRTHNIAYPSVYDKGINRTGCMFCMFGIDQDGCPNKIQRLQELYPKIHSYCLDTLGLRQVCNFMNIPCEAENDR